ncbi:MAG TPA: hypothetical protein DCE41_14895 [Cytophagales bacterium]|nr:hypothetical protein [Cytophagales bacterium]HAA24060.1 hypothetical protein [Cytophagales bacterium]HAP64710.1 hypothetical protein [Cytophagales bacterium]
MNRKILSLTVLGLLVAGSAIGQKVEWQDIQKELQTQLILAEAGDVIEIPAGHFMFTRGLSMDRKSNITIRGAGMSETVLSFDDQEEGAEGLKITNGENITLEGFTILDSKGDAIKTQYITGLTFRDVKTAWSGRPKKSNGAYGFYPVQCSNILIEECEAQGASDAGIYVGQSEYVVVRNSKAYENVAGIEIENTSYADVYDNEAYNNTGGILVFDMPNLTRYGSHCRVYSNKVYDNNLKNFAPPGNVVGAVPAGTGIILLATTGVEVFNNELSNHKSVSLSMVSYYLMDDKIDDRREPDYDPYITDISVHDNIFNEKKARFPDLSNELGQLLFLKFKLRSPEIVYDGIVDGERATSPMLYPNDLRLCIRNNGDVRFAYMDLNNGGAKATPILEPEGFDCAKTALTATELTRNK